MLVSLRCSSVLYILDSLEQYLRLRPSAGLLDERTSALHRPIRYVVHQRRHQHRHGLCHHHPPNASHPTSAAWKAPKVSIDRYFRRRRIVSTTFHRLFAWRGRSVSHLHLPLRVQHLKRNHAASYNLTPPASTQAHVSPRLILSHSVCIVSILRLQSLVAISNSTDQSYDNPAAATWSSVETNVGIICSCLPLLRPLMTRCLPGVFSSHRRGTRSTPRVYPTIGSARSRPLPSHNGDYALETTAKGSSGGSRGSSDAEGRDIQVQTHIHVSVEGGKEGYSPGGGGGGNGWETPRSKRTDGRSSTDSLVKGPNGMV